jgi:hypothetical protein
MAEGFILLHLRGAMDGDVIVVCSHGHVSYPVFLPKPSSHHMHDPGSIVPHIQPKVFTDNQMSRIKYNYYINILS